MRKVVTTFLRRAAVCTGFLGFCWLAGFGWFCLQVPRQPLEATESTDAIVVLTGGSKRVAHGLKLLAEGKASRLFISGVEKGVTPAELIARNRPSIGGLPERVHARDVLLLGYDARNTIGNAMETARWAEREKLQSLRLVTANYHMPRALFEFRQIMPGITIIPDTVLPEDFAIADWWKLGASSRLLMSEYHKYIAARLRHWLIAAVEETV